jgi:hypothetical protein
MFKFIVVSLLSVIGSGYLTLGIATYFTVGYTTALVLSGVVGLVLATGFIIPVGKTFITGLALNGLTGGTSGGYNRVS